MHRLRRRIAERPAEDVANRLWASPVGCSGPPVQAGAIAQAKISQTISAATAAIGRAAPVRASIRSVAWAVALDKAMDRLVTAYQEDLLSIDELRQRMPALKRRDQTRWAELHAIADQARARGDYMKLAETLSAFLERLRVTADTLKVEKRQQILRLLVHAVLVGDDTIVIRHNISVPANPTGAPASGAVRSKSGSGCEGYLLRIGSGQPIVEQ